MLKRFPILLTLIVLAAFAPKAFAAKDFNIKNNSQSFLYVNGTSGNVGIGSVAPGQLLDVQGTVRAIGLTMSGQTPVSGYVLTASDSSGDTTWTSPGASSGWTVSGNNVYETSGGNVGIGTNLLTTAALTVMNGNVGIGTWIPGFALDVVNTARFKGGLFAAGNPNAIQIQSSAGNPIVTFGYIKAVGGFGLQSDANSGGGSYVYGSSGAGLFVNSAGNVGISSISPNGQLDVEGTLSPVVFNAIPGTTNVGIGSFAPGQRLDVQGTARMTGFTLSGNGAASGNVLVGNSVGVGTWMPAGTLPGLIGGLTTNYVTKASSATSITNSLIFDTGVNVGIGSSNPNAALDVVGAISVEGAGNSYFSSNVGIGSTAPGQALDITGTVRMTGFTLTGNGAANGNVLVGNSVGVGTWMPASTLIAGGGSNYWLNDTAGNIGISTTYAVGIGTTFIGGTGEAALSVMNGNVGIGTWVPNGNGNGGLLDVGNATTGDVEIDNAGDLVATGQMDVDGEGVFADGAISSEGFFNASAPAIQGASGGGDADFLLTNSGSAALPNNSSGAGIQIEGAFTTAGSGTHPLIAGAAIFPMAITSGGASITNTAALYIDSAGTATVTGNKFALWVNSGNSDFGGNVGIGSTAPGQKLDVQGTVRTIGLTMSGQTPISGYVLTSQDSAGDMTWSPSSSVGANYWLNDTGNVGINTAYAVGIGTISQVNKLNILGNIGIGTLSFDPYMKTAAPSGGMIIAGNVGIGTWVPAAALQIGANSLSGSGPPPQLFLGTFSNGAGYPQLVGNWNNNTDWGIGQATPSGTDNAILLGVTAAPNFAPFSWGSTGLNVLVSGNIGIGTITTTGMNTNLYVPTNIGIGTKAPSDTLDVVGSPSSGDIAVFQDTSASGQSDIGFRDNNVIGRLWIGYGNSSSGAPYAGNSFMEFDSPAFGIYNNNGAVLNEYFTSSGNVGIGTLSPLSKFNVNGGVGIGTTLTNGAYISGNSAPSGGLIVQGNVGIGTFNPFGGGLIVLPANTGNVGIGSLSPGQALDVQGTLRDLGVLVNGNVGIGTTFINGTNESALTVMNGNVGIGTWAGGGALVVMNGNVGIGTTNPTYQLAVAKTANINTLTTNKSTFMAVSYGTGAGASDNISVPAATFTKINFHSLTGYTLIDNGGNYSATNDWYTTPVSGVYMIITKFRITDSQTQFISYGQGAGTAAADSPTFLWCQTATTTATRNGSHNVQFQHYAAGSNIEMFVYTNVALDSSDGDFQVYLVSAD